MQRLYLSNYMEKIYHSTFQGFLEKWLILRARPGKIQDESGMLGVLTASQVSLLPDTRMDRRGNILMYTNSCIYIYL